MKKIILILFIILNIQFVYSNIDYKPCGGTHLGNSNYVDDIFIREKLANIYENENICD